MAQNKSTTRDLRACVFLASPEFASNATGVVLPVIGGVKTTG